MLKYFKNFILCGEIDFFCLLCKETFELDDQVEKHIRWEQHRKFMKNQEYLAKLKKDCVYKLPDHYYCEICNYITSTFGAIKSHVKGEDHIAKIKCNENTEKETLVKRDYDFVIVSKNMINKKEWHSVVNDKCFICNTTVDNFGLHIALPSHMINLIQSHVIKGPEDHIYRKINEDALYCFECKQTFSPETLTGHWTSEDHMKNANQGKDKVQLLFEIDKKNSMATCVLCNQTIVWSCQRMHHHRDAHIKKGEWIRDKNESAHMLMLLTFQDKGKIRSDLKKFGKDNFIKMNEGGSRGFCTLCKIQIPAHIRNFREHINGIRHASFLEFIGHGKKPKIDKPRFKTKPLTHFVKDVMRIKSAGSIIIPGFELCVNMMSFIMIAPIDKKSNRVVCYVCDGVYPDVDSHFDEEHRQKLFKTELVVSPTLKKEFIREIRPGLYHCGVCNLAFAGWSIIERHLNMFKHLHAQAQAHKRIREVVDPGAFDCEGNVIDPSDYTNVKPETLFLN